MKPIARHGAHCSACGDGVASLGLDFQLDDDGHVHSAMTLDERHQGAPGFVHGGMLVVAIDDALGTLPLLLGRRAVTASLTTDFRAPALLGEAYRVEVWVERVEGRKIHSRGLIAAADDTVVCEARALFLEVDPEHFTARTGRDLPLPY